MNKEQYEAIMPIICNDLVKYISQKQNISLREAINKLYNSHLYRVLENEKSKTWHYSTPMLYNLFEQEEQTGTIKFPDV